MIEGNTYRIEGFLLNPKKCVFPSIYLLFQIIDDLLQQGTNIPERLLNKPYVNDVTLRGQKSSLKCC